MFDADEQQLVQNQTFLSFLNKYAEPEPYKTLMPETAISNQAAMEYCCDDRCEYCQKDRVVLKDPHLQHHIRYNNYGTSLSFPEKPIFGAQCGHSGLFAGMERHRVGEKHGHGGLFGERKVTYTVEESDYLLDGGRKEKDFGRRQEVTRRSFV